MSVRETDDIFRLYRREWITVHTVTMTGERADDCVMQAHRWALENLHGRVLTEEINLVANTDLHGLFWVWVRVFKENLKGEFKFAATAESFAKAQGYDEFTVVPRNSKEDHAIRNYGVKKL